MKGVHFFIFIILSVVLCSGVNSGGNERFRIIRQDGELLQVLYRFDERIDMSNYEESTSEHFAEFCRVAGQAALPVESFICGIPAGAELSVAAEALEFEEFRGVDLDEYVDKPGSSFISLERELLGKDTLAEASGTGWVRSQRIAGIRIYPYYYEKSERKLIVRRKAMIWIEFSGGRSWELNRSDPMGEIFESSMQSMLLNYDQARCFRGESPCEAGGESMFSPTGDAEWYKMEICDERAAIRIDDQIDLTGKNYENFQIWNRGHQVAARLTGVEDESFDEGDYLEFYAHPLRYNDDSEDFYTTCNVYWFTIGETPGERLERYQIFQGTQQIAENFPEELRIEENRIPSWAEDKWMWQQFNAGEESSIQFSIHSPDEVSEEQAFIKIRLQGKTSDPDIIPDHHAKVYLNGELLCDAQWDGWDAYDCEASIDHQLLLDGQNEISIEMPGDTAAGEFDQIWLNWIDIKYNRLYEAKNGKLKFRSPVTGGPSTVRFIIYGFDSPNINIFDISRDRFLSGVQIQQSGSEYNAEFQMKISNPVEFFGFQDDTAYRPEAVPDAPSDLKNTSHQADYIMISNQELMQESETLYDIYDLVDLQTQRGYNVKLVDIEDIYDEFNHGIFNPPAITSFMDYAYHNWRSPAPTHLLLVGDSTWDYKGYLPEGVKENLVPSYGKNWSEERSRSRSAYIDQFFAGEKYEQAGTGYDPDDFIYGNPMVDQQFVCVSGDDNLPDMSVGRLSVPDVQDLSLVISKSIKAENGLPPGYWIRNMVFITGGVDDIEQNTLRSQTDCLIDQYIRPNYSGLNPVRIHKEKDGYDWGIYEQDVIDAFDAGAVIVNFFGHAGTWSWECILDFDDLPDINNQGKLPFVMSMTCNTARFANPVIDAFGEEMMTVGENSCALGFWGGHSFGGLWSDYYLTSTFFDRVFFQKNHITGIAIMEAKIHNQLIHPDYCVFIEPYTLLSDPAMPLTFRSNPSLVMGGYFDKKISQSQGGNLQFLAFGLGLDGTAVEKMEIYYDGLPTGVYLQDNGASNDFAPGDGVFGLTVPLNPGQVPQNRYLLELTGRDYFNNKTKLWPYLNVTQD